MILHGLAIVMLNSKLILLYVFLSCNFSYLLQYDASQYGASTQQQWQHAHQSHSDIKRYTSVVLSWRFKREEAERLAVFIKPPVGWVLVTESNYKYRCSHVLQHLCWLATGLLSSFTCLLLLQYFFDCYESYVTKSHPSTHSSHHVQRRSGLYTP